MLNNDLYVDKADDLLRKYHTYLLVIKNYAKNTISLYYNTADGFMYFLKLNNYYHIKQIDKNTFSRYLTYVKLNSKISNQTTNMLISSLNNLAEFLCLTYNACELQKLKQLKFISKIPNIIDQEDMLLLLKMKNPDYDKLSTWVSYRNYAICILLYSTGMRISEAMNVLLSDIANDQQWIRIENAKNNKTRVVPINIHVLISLNNYREVCPFEIYSTLWFSSKGTRLTATAAAVSITHMFGKSPHYFRHAFATHLVLNDCDLLVVKEFLGHSSIATTSIYTHVKPKHLLEAVRCHPMNLANN
ncbi:MAG: tyrosine-type recombinase/integrase [Sulfurimonas sp.]|jgi:site-specific recombinase XerD